MADISNKTLAILVGIAIVVSIVGIMSIGKPSVLYITGRGTTDAGNVSVNLTEEVSILVQYNIEFGSGRVEGGNTSATLESNNTADVGGSWTWAKQYIRVDNDGTVNVTLNVSASNSTSYWLGGTSPTMSIKGWETEVGACTNKVSLETYRDISTANLKVTLCPNLQFGSAKDTVNTSIKLVVPSDAVVGHRNVLLTYSAVKAAAGT